MTLLLILAHMIQMFSNLIIYEIITSASEGLFDIVPYQLESLIELLLQQLILTVSLLSSYQLESLIQLLHQNHIL